jgi:hypothetical protein
MRQWRDKFPGKTVVAGDDMSLCCTAVTSIVSNVF